MDTKNSFHSGGVFEWQFPNPDRERAWRHYSYDERRWWGDFPARLPMPADLFAQHPWALGPFRRYLGNPVLAPTPGRWDCGRHDGGVHNGSVLIHNGLFHYVYRGERPIDIPRKTEHDYICDIGLATSEDGINFVKDYESGPFFRKGEDRRYSYEDVNIARYGDTYYLFCNQWLWENQYDTRLNGTFLAVSQDLRRWEKVGIVFPKATRLHRNAVVLQNPTNEAIRVGGRFVMYINDGLMGVSDDMLHWDSVEIADRWPGGEGCFALADHDETSPEDIVLFTGGPHTGHFYAVGEVRLSKADPAKALDYLHRPVLHADHSLPWENGRSVENPTQTVSSFADCVFFNGLTRHQGKWWMYYGGSEYYTCLATAEASRKAHATPTASPAPHADAVTSSTNVSSTSRC